MAAAAGRLRRPSVESGRKAGSTAEEEAGVAAGTPKRTPSKVPRSARPCGRGQVFSGFFLAAGKSTLLRISR